MRYVRLKKQVPLNLIMIEDNFVAPRDFMLEFTLYTNSFDDSLVGVIAQNQAFQKILYVLEECFNLGIVYEFKNKELLEKFFADYENPFITVPNISEITLIECLHAKLNALCGDHSHVDCVELSEEKSGQSWIFAIDDETNNHYMLPEQKDFAGKFAYFPDAPWWHRYDTTVFDNYANDEAGLEEWNTKIKSDVFDSATVHVLNDIDDAIKNAFNKQEPTEIIDLEEFKAEINKRKKWKPTLV